MTTLMGSLVPSGASGSTADARVSRLTFHRQ
jgi:hypothetical protein